MNLTLKIGGVPEHFNLPWHLALAQKKFTQQAIDLQWTDYPGGTGTMAKALRDRELDMAVLLTEGITKDILQGNASKIVQVFVKSPLIWGIHTAAQAPYQSIAELQGKRVAISRIGSGSHLMAYVDARRRGWQLTDNQLVVVKDLAGARAALANHQADLFMWEKFMTKPLVDAGEFRRLDECLTPWACFVIAVRDEILAQYPEQIRQILAIIKQAGADFKQNPQAARLVSEKFNLKPIDAQNWFTTTTWASDNQIRKSEIEEVIQTLYELDFVPELQAVNQVLAMDWVELV
ncbi:MAG: substrate-binding domain-containing protein [Microscillaceae bacterium]|jgi:ABC-type nitrate/sulfonate/bicarbonate transport system substrate-binding protein|nr:substrate-binding domain-containing protein [Microscillaceae bacterium]